MEPDKTPEQERHLIAVLRTQADVARVRERLLAEGVAESEIAVDAAADEIPALRAEMRAELSDAVVLPHAAFIADKEGARGFLLSFAALALIGIVVSFPLALIDVGLSYWTRFLVIAGTILIMAFTIALVLGTAWGSRNTDDPSAASRGVIMRIGEDTARIRDILAAADPIRVDEITADGEPAATVYTESRDADRNLAPKVADTVEHMRDASHKPQ